MTEFEVVATGLQFPEGPIAMADGSVILVEIARGTLSRVDARGQVEVVADLGGGPNGAAIGPDGLCYVCNSGGFGWQNIDGLLFPDDVPADYAGGRIERVNLATGQFERLYDHCGEHGLSGPNDIVFDRHGGFWFSDTGKLSSRKITRGAIYYGLPKEGGLTEVIQPTDLANGIALSPDERTLYFCETLNGRLWQFPIVAPGKVAADAAIGNAENLLHAPGGFIGYDSMAVDSAGNVCQATLFSGGISVISPSGELVDFHEFPDPLVTNVCFGGGDLRTAYITLSATGQLVKMRWPRPGLALNFLSA
nr:lactonase drp35-like [Nerophis lumbriciformis]